MGLCRLGSGRNLYEYLYNVVGALMSFSSIVFSLLQQVTSPVHCKEKCKQILKIWQWQLKSILPVMAAPWAPAGFFPGEGKWWTEARWTEAGWDSSGEVCELPHPHQLRNLGSAVSSSSSANRFLYYFCPPDDHWWLRCLPLISCM